MSSLALFLALQIPREHNPVQMVFADLAHGRGLQATTLLSQLLAWAMGIGLCWTLYWKKDDWFLRFSKRGPEGELLDVGALARMTLLLLGAWMALRHATELIFEIHDLWLRWPGQANGGTTWQEWLETQAHLEYVRIDWAWYGTWIVLGLCLFAFSSPIARWWASQWPQEPPSDASAESPGGITDE